MGQCEVNLNVDNDFLNITWTTFYLGFLPKKYIVCQEQPKTPQESVYCEEWLKIKISVNLTPYKYFFRWCVYAILTMEVKAAKGEEVDKLHFMVILQFAWIIGVHHMRANLVIG